MLDLSRITCPLPMRPLDLWVTRLFCGGEVAGSLLHYQREAHRVGYESDTPEDQPLLGTPSHCLVGLPPPWDRDGLSAVPPQAVLLVALRHRMGVERLAPRLFAAEAARVARKYKTPMRKAPTCFHPETTLLFDVFVVYARFIKAWSFDAEDADARTYWRARAEYEILQRIQNGGGEAACEIATAICEAIDIEFC